MDLKAIQERCEKATPGPWRVVDVYHAPERVSCIVPERDKYERIVETDSGCYGPSRPDADFIAHARSDIPALLERVRQLEEALRGLLDSSICEGYPDNLANIVEARRALSTEGEGE